MAAPAVKCCRQPRLPLQTAPVTSEDILAGLERLFADPTKWAKETLYARDTKHREVPASSPDAVSYGVIGGLRKVESVLTFHPGSVGWAREVLDTYDRLERALPSRFRGNLIRFSLDPTVRHREVLQLIRDAKTENVCEPAA